MAIRIAFFNNQGGDIRLSFYAGIAAELPTLSSTLEPIVVVWANDEVAKAKKYGAFEVVAYEEWTKKSPDLDDAELRRIAEEYPDVVWGEVVATERSFTDYSLLLGSAGDRKESVPYVASLLHRIILFFEYLFLEKAIKVIACPTADTLFTLVGFKVAARYQVTVISESAAWLIPEEMSGAGMFTSNEFMSCPRMRTEYAKLRQRTILDSDLTIAQAMAKTILGFRGKTNFAEKTKGKKAGFSAISPNTLRAWHHYLANRKLDKSVAYTKFELWEKIRANLLRVMRKAITKKWLGTRDVSAIPNQSIFFALQYQPEQSTLTQANWYANQIYVIECISRSLPNGYTLVVKEHPWGRGNRPIWQYKHVTRLYNVMMCDAPAREIIQKVKAVVSLPGTVAIESLVMGCPTVLMGRAFFDYSELFYKLDHIQQLPYVLKSILIDKNIQPHSVREIEIARFLLAYRAGLIPAFPMAENAKFYAKEFIKELILRDEKWAGMINGDAVEESGAVSALVS